MYYLETNKQNPNNAHKNNKRAKTFTRGLCNFAILAAFTMSSVIPSFAEQPLAYGNYPIIRGVTNPQEASKDFNITDAGSNLRQMVLLSTLDVITPTKGKIQPNKLLTNEEMLISMVKLSNNDADILSNDPDRKTKYIQRAIELGYTTQASIDAVGTDKYMSSTPTMRVLNASFSKVLNTETKYNTEPDKKATRLDLANLIYANKVVILKQYGIDIYSGHILTKSSIVEDGKNKTLVTVKLDKNLMIKKEGTDKKNTGTGATTADTTNTQQKPEYATNQVNKLVEDNKDDATRVSYINLISQNDVPVLTPSGITMNTQYIWPESQVNIYAKNNKILYAEQYSVETKEVVGVFESIVMQSKELEELKSTDKTVENSSNIIKIKDYNDKVNLYKLHPDVKILQYSGELGEESVSKPVDKDQLSYGQDVSLTIRNGVVTVLKAYVPVEEELNAYVPPESEMIGGIVLDVSENNITLTNNKDYTIGADTLIMKDGEIQDYKVIKDGDRIKLFFDDIYSNVPSKVEIEGVQRQADKILKAKVGPYLLTQKSLSLKDVKELQNGQWVDLKENIKAYETIKVKGDIYANSSKVNSNKLKNYKDKEIYAVIAKNNGVPSIAKGKIRLGDSLKFDESIKNIDHSQNTLNIDDNLIKFDESTIIVKDGNIIQSGNLEKNISSNIETNLTKDAQIIIQNGASLSIDKVNKYPYKVYRGTLRDVFEYSILLGNDVENGKKVNHFFMWQGGVWNRLSEGKTTPRLNFTEQTKIYDYDNDRAYAVDEIRQMKNSINTFGIRPEYYNRQVYVVTKDDSVVSIAFAKGEGYVQVNSQNLIVARGVGEYTSGSTPTATTNTTTATAPNNKTGANNTNSTATTSSIPKLLIRNIQQYNSNTNKLESLNPIISTDTATQEIKKTPIRKVINLQKATVIVDGKVIPKTSVDALKDRELVIIFKQNRTKALTDNMEELDAITIIAK